MAKNKNKQKKESNELMFDISKNDLRMLIKSHKNFVGHSYNNILSNFHIVIKGNVLECATTDGNRLLRTKIQIDNHSKINFEFNIESFLLENLNIFKEKNIPVIRCEINKEEKTIKFIDIEYKFSQIFEISIEQYPNYNEIIKGYKNNENLHTIGLNKSFFKDVSNLYVNDRTQILEMQIDKESATKPILFSSKKSNMQQLAVLMPLLLRD